MDRLGIINNVRAGRNRSRLERVRALLDATGGESREVDDLASIREATRVLMDRDIDVLAVNGGDGTAQAVITALMRRGGRLPELAIVPGGTTNMIANDLNESANLQTTLRSLAARMASPRDQRAHTHRPVIHVQAAGIEPQYGLYVGAGVVLRGMRHFQDHVGSKGMRGELAAGISVISGMIGLATGRGEWNDTGQVLVRPDGTAEPWRDQILVSVTTLERLMLGLRPWWGEQAAPIHLTAVRRSPRSLVRLAPAFLKGRRHPRMSAENGYRSENVDRLVLQVSDGFAMDGEIFDLEPDQTVEVTATDPVRFLRL